VREKIMVLFPADHPAPAWSAHMSWDDICKTCPHHKAQRCISRGTPCKEIQKLAELPDAGFTVTESGSIRERVSRPPLSSDIEDFDKLTPRRVEHQAAAQLFSEARYQDSCMPGCQRSLVTIHPRYDGPKRLGLTLPAGFNYLPPEQWYCGRCGCRVRARRLMEPGRCEYDECPMCEEWKRERWWPNLEPRHEMKFTFRKPAPELVLRFSSREDFVAAHEALLAIDQYIQSSAVPYRVYWLTVWGLFGFTDEHGLRPASSLELVEKLPALGFSSRTFRRDLTDLRPHLDRARELLNHGWDPRFNIAP